MGNMMNFKMYPVAEGVPLGPEMLGAFQFWFSFQTFVVLGMGISGFIKPGSDAITKDGYWEYIGDSPDAKKAKDKGKVVMAPNARSWAVRSAFAGIMNMIGFYYGTKECYVIMAACAAFRETVDSIECFIDGGDAPKKAYMGYPIPAGKFPPIIYFPPWAGGAVVNFMFVYYLIKD